MKKTKMIPAENFLNDLSAEERKQIEQEKKYYRLVVSLKQKREQLGLSQGELAKLAKLPRTTITKVESGSRNTTLETLMSMANAMGRDLVIGLR